MSVRIIPFQPHLAPAFKELNIAWLTEYFYVEPKDSDLLDNCQEVIIDKGGVIFFAQLKESIVGCFSLIPMGTNTVELGKMAVREGYQGKKIGHQLLKYAIDYCNKNQIASIVLYSNTVLQPAIYLYKKFGFQEIPMEVPPPYDRSNIKMALIL
ncbi:GNAT family N-acetyltransferase [uncultured Muriicola sp.]|uniref:GNAT family N-acetyltransferase n=1 Tax=uncultured Muriicola sp. TaxID=1583102 RepID=UPI00260D253D|nr:GNAT family N-acetyltransferase [uncultured Muriicola sp.]